MNAVTIHNVEQRSEREYRALPGLSGSGVARLLKNPRTFRDPIEPSEAMRFGTAFHARVLGADEPFVITEQWATLTGAASKVWAEGVEAAGGIPVLAAWLPRLDAMEAAIQRNPTAITLLMGPGVNETPLVSEWRGVPVKGKPDRVLDFQEGIVVVDLKTTNDPTDAKAIFERGYDLQTFFYERLAVERYGKPAAQAPYIVAVGSTHPHTCVVWQFDQYDRAVANEAIDNALVLYAECTRRDEWPDWAEHTVQRPTITPWQDRARIDAHNAAEAWLNQPRGGTQ